jgi:hypothetical protein
VPRRDLDVVTPPRSGAHGDRGGHEPSTGKGFPTVGVRFDLHRGAVLLGDAPTQPGHRLRRLGVDVDEVHGPAVEGA